MCLFFPVGNYFIRNNCVDFLLKQFHTVRMRLTFLEVCFLCLDNKIHFCYDTCVAVIIQIHNCRFSTLQKAAKIAAILENSVQLRTLKHKAYEAGWRGPFKIHFMDNSFPGTCTYTCTHITSAANNFFHLKGHKSC